MESPYWKQMEVQPSYKEWHQFLEGCMACACDHGCNQWVAEQSRKSALFMRILSTKGSTSLDKLAQMPLERANKIWFRLLMWSSEKFNREWKRDEQKQKE